MKAYIAPGKIGDIINILPLLSEEKRKTGISQTLIVARKYADLVKHLSYINLVVYEGSWEDLKGSIVFAKERFWPVEVLSVYGNGFSFQHKTPSFLMEPWERAGKLASFDTLPLIIDGRDREREFRLTQKLIRGPFVLYADHGESSPFPHKEALMKLLRDVLPMNVTIIRLSEIRAEHFFDFVAFYEKASLLVATETAHLHLSAAVPIPVIAFTKDLPSRWHGSPHCRRFSLTCRYSDFERRRPEIVAALQDPFGTSRAPSVPMMTHQKFGYNPTIMAGFPGMIYRYHPDKSWRTRLVYQNGPFESHIKFPEQFDGMSMEDARLFMFQGKPHISFVAARTEFGQTNAVTGYGELILGDTVRVEKVFVPEYGMNNWGGIEKNFVFFEHVGKLMCIYDSQTVLEVEGARVRAVYRSEAKSWEWGQIRGGAIIQWKGRLLRFFHSHTTEGHRDRWIYNIGAVLMEAKPPFQMLQISKSPIIAGDEKLNLYCRHWKQNVVFPGGVRPESDQLVLAYGYNDCECRMTALTDKDLNL